MSPAADWQWPPPLWLRPLHVDDEPAVAAAQAAMAVDDFEFASGYPSEKGWTQYLAGLERRRIGVELPEGRVPATLLVADADGEIVGRASIRHRLNQSLEQKGGHIGFGVLPQFRRRGYATDILRQSLVIARSAGVRSALLTCDDDNLASATVIERCGGVLDGVVESEDDRSLVRRYWISYH